MENHTPRTLSANEESSAGAHEKPSFAEYEARASRMPTNTRKPSSDHFIDFRPSFTAVNEVKSNHEKQKDPQPSRPNSRQERPKSPKSRPPRATTQQERPPSPDRSSSADRSVPQSVTSPTQRPETPDESRNQYVSSETRTNSSRQSKTATISPQKRKRSYSEDHENVNNNPSYHSHGLPVSPERQRMYPTENGRAHEPENPSPPTYPPPPENSHPPELYPRPERHQLIRSDYDQRMDQNIAPAPPRGYYSEARLAEVLLRENHVYDAVPPRDSFASPEDDDDQHAQQYGDYGTNRSSQSGHDMDRKRRKRVFSNRTKTGCMTCRRRKKKCDEQHPECE